jgi:hypothetical protein
MPNFAGARKSERHDNAHRKARRLAFAQLPEWSPCCRCHEPMRKWAKDEHGKSALHYDHNDNNTGYLGFSHKECNQRAGARKGRRLQHANNPGRDGLGTPGSGW